MNTIVITVSGRRVLNELMWAGGVQTSIVVLLLLLFPLQFPHPNVSCLVPSLPPGCQPGLSLKWERWLEIYFFTFEIARCLLVCQPLYGIFEYQDHRLDYRCQCCTSSDWSECWEAWQCPTVGLVVRPELTLSQVTFAQLNPSVGNTIWYLPG